MIKILFIAPYKELEVLAKAVFAEYTESGVLLEAIEAVGVMVIEQLELDYDVVIARGVTASAIAQRRKELTVIELPVTGFDVHPHQFNPRPRRSRDCPAPGKDHQC